MDYEPLLKILGAALGGGLFLWFSKLMITRAIKQIDDNIKDHDKRVREIEADIAVLKFRADQVKTDLNNGLKSVRNLQKEKCNEHGKP